MLRRPRALLKPKRVENFRDCAADRDASWCVSRGSRLARAPRLPRCGQRSRWVV